MIWYEEKKVSFNDPSWLKHRNNIFIIIIIIIIIIKIIHRNKKNEVEGLREKMDVKNKSRYRLGKDQK